MAGGDIDPLRAAADELDSIRRRLDALEFFMIQFARSRGATWDEVGQVLGISRQAAQSRFSKLRRRQRR